MYRSLCLLFMFALLVVSCSHSTHEQKLLLYRADSLMQIKPDSALYLLKKITNYKQLAKGDKAWFAVLWNKALLKNDIEVSSDTLIRYATNHYGKDDPINAGYAWYLLSRCEKSKGNAQGEADALFKAQEYAIYSKNLKLQACVWDAKSLMYKSQHKLDSMYHYANLAYLAFQKQKDTRNAVVCLLNMGINSSMSKRLDRALAYYLKAEELAKHTNEPLLLSSAYTQLCYTYYQMGNYPRALQYSRLSTKTSDYYDYNKWINMASIYIKTGALDSAHYYLSKGSPSVDRIKFYYELWETLHEKRGDFKSALIYEKKYAFILDSLNKKSLSESFAGLEKKYNYQKYQTENQSLTINNQRKNILILVLLLLLSSVAMLFFIFKNRQHRKLLTRQRLLTSKEEALVKKEQEKNTILAKQFDIQQNALKAISLLKQNASTFIKADDVFKDTKTKKEFVTQQNEALSALYKNTIENVDLLYNNISKRLATSFPDLLESDILICCLLLAGFDNISIASLLDILPKSYNMRRTILRKKLNIPHEVNLTEFLANF